MKLFSISKISAIFSAVFLFLFSTIHLIYFGVYQNAIKKSDSKIIGFVVDNYKNLNIWLIVLLFFTFAIISIAYFFWTKRNNQDISKYLTILLFIAFIISTFSSLSVYASSFNLVSISQNASKVILSSIQLLFATSLLLYQKNRKTALLSIAPMYIINSLFVFSTLFIPVQLLDLTIAIRIVESVFFSQED